MRPGCYEGINLKGIKKRLKDKAFAAGVSREEINDACDRTNIESDDSILILHGAAALIHGSIQILFFF